MDLQDFLCLYHPGIRMSHEYLDQEMTFCELISDAVNTFVFKRRTVDHEAEAEYPPWTQHMAVKEEIDPSCASYKPRLSHCPGFLAFLISRTHLGDGDSSPSLSPRFLLLLLNYPVLTRHGLTNTL